MQLSLLLQKLDQYYVIKQKLHDFKEYTHHYFKLGTRLKTPVKFYEVFDHFTIVTGRMERDTTTIYITDPEWNAQPTEPMS